MNRINSLKINLEPYMTESAFQEAIELYNIEWQIGKDKQGNRVIWLETHDRNIFDFVPNGEELNILENLSLWYDDSEKEIRINEHNYRYYDNSLYYSRRKGIYDIEIFE